MDDISDDALETLAAAGLRAAGEYWLDEALQDVADAVGQVTGADVTAIRVADDDGRLPVRAVASRSEALAAELAGSAFSLDVLPAQAASSDDLPDAVRRAARRARAADALLIPVRADGAPLGSLEILRVARRFDERETAAARLAASHIGLVLRAFGAGDGVPSSRSAESLSLAGDALGAGLEEARGPDEVVRIAARASGAQAVKLWQVGADAGLELLASTGRPDALEAVQAEPALGQEQEPVRIEAVRDWTVVTLTLGHPPLGVLQLVFSPGASPTRRDVDRLGTFAVRAAQALRAGERARTTSEELERSEALLAVLGQAIAELSLAHILETAVARVAELLSADRVAIYLGDANRLRPEEGAGSGADAELTVAERLLELAFGPLRVQGVLQIADAQADLRLAPVREAVAEAEIDAALAVPLVAREELVGLLAVYLPRGRTVEPNETALLSALAAQLAVAAQNAELHERTERQAAELQETVASERKSAKRLRALYEISRSFAQSLSLDTTLDSVTTAAVELLDADAAVIRVHDARGDLLVPRAPHIADPRLEALRPLLEREQAADKLPGRRLFRMGKPLVLDPPTARRLGASYELLVPFLEQGATAVVVPIATSAELLATLTVVSLDPSRRLGDEQVETALFVAGQAALAIDNARLTQERKDFADTMQRSLLPRGLPEVEGLEVGAVYESSARVEVGGDVYDFLTLPEGELAVVLGDASGHGIAATADMALAKFAFRSLVRLYPDPAALLAQANEVALGELAGGNFVTMACLTVHPETGHVSAASAGHPPIRLLAPDGAISLLAPRGLALGIEPDQRYETATASLEHGSALCLFTDGLIEARRGGDQYGEERLHDALSSARDLSAQALVEHVVADARAFAGEPDDDYAVVVIRRT
ncbi:MAG: GAF domain-containing protein [Actinobacteria bacterium]|nr:MAG: GAF domain-containing protein [Actinomycetota bacterium]